MYEDKIHNIVIRLSLDTESPVPMIDVDCLSEWVMVGSEQMGYRTVAPAPPVHKRIINIKRYS